MTKTRFLNDEILFKYYSNEELNKKLEISILNTHKLNAKQCNLRIIPLVHMQIKYISKPELFGMKKNIEEMVNIYTDY